MRKQHPVSQVGLAIRRAVKEQPGIHFRGLGRAAQVTSAGQLRHHLDRLERQGLIVEIEDGRYKRFFVAGDQDPKLRAEMARFSRAVPRRIAKLLLVNPMNRTELRRSLGCADSTLGYHLTRMVQLGDLARTRGPSSCLYSLTSQDTVRKMLTIQGALSDPGLGPAAPGLEPVSVPAPAPAPMPMPGPDPTPAPIPVPGRAPEPSPDEDDDPAPTRPDPVPGPQPDAQVGQPQLDARPPFPSRAGPVASRTTRTSTPFYGIAPAAEAADGSTPALAADTQADAQQADADGTTA
jgi:DNA-binding HxlR family transcriptional regulator